MNHGEINQCLSCFTIFTTIIIIIIIIISTIIIVTNMISIA